MLKDALRPTKTSSSSITISSSSSSSSSSSRSSSSSSSRSSGGGGGSSSGALPEVLYGPSGLVAAAAAAAADCVVAAVSGFKGLGPSLEALRSGKDLALATKEALVAAGGPFRGLKQQQLKNVTLEQALQHV
ncbi:hypothetical protein, conserved [Eimeria brunetti]|uniref:1-deoxy-D-xylulose 5-phosphate reductoisomerase N-terminal domain-containing protein n=1 Tax=Eimeria brunetti TaxID=51314 RepID=U6LFP2_9EIME|nr:hypothetical protein, conserved [Eimeria brunetti]